MKDSDTKKTTRADSIDNYLATLPEDERAALETLRRIIRIAVPDATEVIRYRMPMYKYHGKLLVGFAAFKGHCSFFVMSPNVMRAHAVELKSYDITEGGGGIRFPVNKPLPATLVTKLVKARIAENEERATKKKADKK